MHTRIPDAELEVFKELKDIKVVFDVGARDDIDYLVLKPGITLHAFEPHPLFFTELRNNVGGTPNVFLNNYGLGDVPGEFSYNEGSQAMDGGEAFTGETALKLSVKTLDWYIEENRITRIDFLKIDVEGYDYKVLLGGPKAIKLCRFIQYEHWNEKEQYHTLLGDDFDMEYIGYRNVLCMSKKRVSLEERTRLKELFKERNYAALA